ncbi:MAG: IMP dehydrogenase [Phycisphaerales bacterium]|nr:IMP dehydrogenase [Phycisphaerales bacterium]
MEARTVSKSTPATPANGSAGGGSAASAAGKVVATPVDQKIVAEGVTFDDVLLLPRYSDVVPVMAETSTQLTRSIRLHIPLVSAPMDTVTESALAIALAQQGGLGIIHRNIPVEVQAREVQKVKRSANGVIADPLTLSPEDPVAKARQLMARFHVSGFPVTEGGAPKGKLLGILTRRDLKFVENDQTPVGNVMTSGRIITAAPGTTLAEAEKVLNKHKVEKLLLVDGQGLLAGMITMRDIDRLAEFPHALLDGRGRLRCGAAVGVDQYDRAEALVAADADVLVVDTSHGHSENVLRTVRTLKKKFNIEVIAGNIATADAARALVDAGADAVKAGIGPGSICTTRVVTGVGVPQLTAIMESVRGVGSSGVSVIADGGIRQSGDIAKAIAAGASAVMMGGMFAGLDEAPGEMVIRLGRRYKSYRGMGSEGAMNAGSADRYQQHPGAAGGGAGFDPPPTLITDKAKQKFVPEGVEGLIAYRGPLSEFVYQMVGGLKASMGYVGCKTIAEMHEHARFIKVSGATVIENHPHDIRITKESPNYVREGGGGME